MRINEVEALVGITKKNIRFYEAEGLLTPRRNSENGYWVTGTPMWRCCGGSSFCEAGRPSGGNPPNAKRRPHRGRPGCAVTW